MPEALAFSPLSPPTPIRSPMSHPRIYSSGGSSPKTIGSPLAARSSLTIEVPRRKHSIAPDSRASLMPNRRPSLTPDRIKSPITHMRGRQRSSSITGANLRSRRMSSQPLEAGRPWSPGRGGKRTSHKETETDKPRDHLSAGRRPSSPAEAPSSSSSSWRRLLQTRKPKERRSEIDTSPFERSPVVHELEHTRPMSAGIRPETPASRPDSAVGEEPVELDQFESKEDQGPVDAPTEIDDIPQITLEVLFDKDLIEDASIVAIRRVDNPPTSPASVAEFVAGPAVLNSLPDDVARNFSAYNVLHIDFAGIMLRHLPTEIIKLNCPQLQSLIAPHNLLTEWSEIAGLSGLKSLQRLDVSGNPMPFIDQRLLLIEKLLFGDTTPRPVSPTSPHRPHSPEHEAAIATVLVPNSARPPCDPTNEDVDVPSGPWDSKGFVALKYLNGFPITRREVILAQQEKRKDVLDRRVRHENEREPGYAQSKGFKRRPAKSLSDAIRAAQAGWRTADDSKTVTGGGSMQGLMGAMGSDVGHGLDERRFKSPPKPHRDSPASRAVDEYLRHHHNTAQAARRDAALTELTRQVIRHGSLDPVEEESENEEEEEEDEALDNVLLALYQSDVTADNEARARAMVMPCDVSEYELGSIPEVDLTSVTKTAPDITAWKEMLESSEKPQDIEAVFDRLKILDHLDESGVGEGRRLHGYSWKNVLMEQAQIERDMRVRDENKKLGRRLAQIKNRMNSGVIDPEMRKKKNKVVVDLAMVMSHVLREDVAEARPHETETERTAKVMDKKEEDQAPHTALPYPRQPGRREIDETWVERRLTAARKKDHIAGAHDATLSLIERELEYEKKRHDPSYQSLLFLRSLHEDDRHGAVFLGGEKFEYSPAVRRMVETRKKEAAAAVTLGQRTEADSAESAHELDRILQRARARHEHMSDDDWQALMERCRDRIGRGNLQELSEVLSKATDSRTAADAVISQY